MDLLSAGVIIVILSVLFLYLGLRLNVPSIVIFLVLGILVGPYGLGLITSREAIDTFGNVGIMLLLFTIGLEFSFRELLTSWRTIVIGGTIQICTTVVIITLVSAYFGMTFNEALIFGFIVSLSSTAIVTKILQEKGQAGSLQSRTLMGILIFQDLAIIPMILISPLLVGSGGPDMAALPLQVGKVALIILIIIIMARFVIPALLFRVAREKNRELFVITLAGICILIAWLTSEAVLSFTLGAFIAGLIIGESDYNINALGHIIPFRDVFSSIFFLSIGMLLNTHTVFTNFNYVALFVLIIIVVKILTGFLASAAIGMPLRVCIFTSLSLCQIGEFSFVLAKNGLDTSLISDGVYQIFLAGAIITMALTPYFMNASPQLVDLVYRIAAGLKVRLPRETEPGKAVELQDHIIIAGFGLTGRSVAQTAAIAGIPYTVIELNPEIIRQERSGFGSNIMFGDAVQEEVLEHAGIRRARTLVVAVSDQEAIPWIVHAARKLAPDVYILARTRHVRNVRNLLEMGADEIISEEFEASLEIFSRTLRRYNIPEEEIEYIIRKGRDMEKITSSKGIGGGMQQNNPGRTFHGRRIHTFLIRPGSGVEGKTIGELGIMYRFDIGDMGVRSSGTTLRQIDPAHILKSGDILIMLITDEIALEISPLFENKVNEGTPL